MNLKDWIAQELDKRFSEGFSWDYVVDDDGEVETMEGEPTGNYHYLVAKAMDNDIYLFSRDNILDAQDFVREEIADGDCMANNGRGGPDYKSEWVILDLVERKVIEVSFHTKVEFGQPK